MALTTLANVKLILGITGTDQDARLTALINSASARIEAWCNRQFEAKDCVEWHDGGFALTAKRTPLNTVRRIGITDGSAFTVRYSGSDAVARVDVATGVKGDAGKLRLYSSTAGVTVIPLAGTIAAIITAIGAVSGWSASGDLDGMAVWIPALTGVDAKDTDASVPVAMGELALSRFEPDSGVIEYASSGQFWDGAFSSLGGSLASVDMVVERDHKADYPTTYQGIVLEYNGGMGTIPADVEQTCVDLVQMMYQQANNTAMLLQNESLGGYSVGFATGQNGIGSVLKSMDDLIRDRLASYYRFPLSA